MDDAERRQKIKQIFDFLCLVSTGIVEKCAAKIRC